MPAERTGLPAFSADGFDGRYPVRLVTVESARLLEGGRGLVGFGDTRYALLDRRLEITTDTIDDVLGIVNGGVKLGLLDGEDGLAVAIGGKGYFSYGGLIDLGVRRLAEAFADVTDSEVDLSGWIGYATATWSLSEATHAHLAFQHHHPLESRFAVEDSVAGGTGSVEFLDGDDYSAMWGIDHRLFGRALVALLEAGWSFGLDRPRFGAGVDAGSERWRFVFGIILPGVETDLATEPRDFAVSPTLSFHYRF